MWIKICGINDTRLLGEIAALRPDAVGFNFFRGSKRFVEVETAATAVRELSPAIEPVGVFVNHPLGEVRSICRTTGIRTVQLHGDETPNFAAFLLEFQVIRVYRIGTEGCSRVPDDLQQCGRLGLTPRACLVDASVAGAYGGTGMLAPWDVIATGWNAAEWPPLILAGGLTPENVKQAIRTVRPWGVDVAGGVESSPGIKDLRKIEQFIRAARAAS